jgi:hypothetical protein
MSPTASEGCAGVPCSNAKRELAAVEKGFFGHDGTMLHPIKFPTLWVKFGSKAQKFHKPRFAKSRMAYWHEAAVRKCPLLRRLWRLSGHQS